MLDSVAAGVILNAIITLGKTLDQLDLSLLQYIFNDCASVLFILSQSLSVDGSYWCSALLYETLHKEHLPVYS